MVTLRKVQLVSLMQLEILTKPHFHACGGSNFCAISLAVSFER